MSSALVTIAIFADWYDANLAKQELEQEGVAVLLQEEAVTHISAVLGRSVDLGQFQMKVTATERDEAIQILMTAGYLEQEDLSSTPSENEDDWGRPSWADQTADRAFRVAIISLFVPFLQFYSMWLLLRLLIARQPLSRDRWFLVVMTLFINAIWLRIALWVFFPE